MNETTDPVDNLGGILSVVLVAALVLGINFAAVPGKGTVVPGLAIIAVAAGVVFSLRERRAGNPLFDLHMAASRRIFWVAACAGVIVFGTLMGAMFVRQQFLQNVLGYSTLDAGVAILPAAILMVAIAPRSAELIDTHGARFTLLVGYACCLLGFIVMLAMWQQGISYWQVGLAYAFVGAGVGFAGTPASHSLTGSVPVRRAGMASGTADLQRDLGGAIMQSILGALLTAGYASAVATAITAAPASAQDKVTHSVQAQAPRSRSQARNRWRRTTEVLGTDRGGGQDIVRRWVGLGVRGRHRSHPARRRGRLHLVSPAVTKNARCSPATTRRTHEGTIGTPPSAAKAAGRALVSPDSYGSILVLLLIT